MRDSPTKRSIYFFNPGTPPSVGASRTARRIDSATASDAATPNASIDAFSVPIDNAMTTSPSEVVFTGLIALAMPTARRARGGSRPPSIRRRWSRRLLALYSAPGLGRNLSS